MSWHQQMAGAAVRLSPSVEKRIGVAGFGVDDVGVIAEPSSVVALLEAGQQLGALSEQDIEGFVSIEHGSTQQVAQAEKLARKTLSTLGDAIEARVERQLAGVPGTQAARYEEYREWARESLWELPAGVMDAYPNRCFCLGEDGALSVFNCPVANVPGRIGDVLVTLVDLLMTDALKMPALAAIEYVSLMGFSATSLFDHDDFEAMRKADSDRLLVWLKEAEPDLYSEFFYWGGDEEGMAGHALLLREIAFAAFDEQQHIERVVGPRGDPCQKTRGDYVARVRSVAESCEPGALRDFSLTACDLLSGDTTADLMRVLPEDERAERLPGDLAIVDTGLPIEDIDNHYHHLNEIAMNGDDLGYLPLDGNAEAVLPLLTHITVCERLIIALGALLDDEEELSEAKAA